MMIIKVTKSVCELLKMNIPSRSKYHVFKVLNNLSRLESLAEPTTCPIPIALFFLTAALRSVKPLSKADRTLAEQNNMDH